ncbi:MAG: hypothetical protein R2729_29040 [Bryobacteraceae bacterium]
MPAIELIFPAELDRNQVWALLSEPGSGFNPDDRAPLDSTLMDGFAIAGVVLNALSLATAIWTLKAQLDQAARDKKTASNTIRIKRVRTADIRSLPAGEVEEIQRALEEASGADE